VSDVERGVVVAVDVVVLGDRDIAPKELKHHASTP